MSDAPPTIPDDDPQRQLTVADVGDDAALTHIGLVGDTYTILVTGAETAGRYTAIDMHVPPKGGPPPHRRTAVASTPCARSRTGGSPGSRAPAGW